MMLGVSVKQSPDHPLVLRIVPLSLGLEKFDATLAQGEGDLDSFVLKYKILRPGKEISHDPGVSEGFVRVFYFRAHISVFLFANSLRRICESRRPGK